MGNAYAVRVVKPDAVKSMAGEGWRLVAVIATGTGTNERECWMELDTNLPPSKHRPTIEPASAPTDRSE